MRWEEVLPTSLLPDALKESRGAILVKGTAISSSLRMQDYFITNKNSSLNLRQVMERLDLRHNERDVYPTTK